MGPCDDRHPDLDPVLRSLVDGQEFLLIRWVGSLDPRLKHFPGWPVLLQFGLEAELLDLAHRCLQLRILGGQLVALRLHGGDLLFHRDVAASPRIADLGDDRTDDRAHRIFHRVERAAAVQLDEGQARDYEQEDQKERLASVQRRQKRTSWGRWWSGVSRALLGTVGTANDTTPVTRTRRLQRCFYAR